MTQESARLLSIVRRCALVVSAMMATGVVALMILARGKDEDITGIVAPAVLLILVSLVVAGVVGVLQRRAPEPGRR